MAKFKCPKCRKLIDLKAEICPYCQTAFTPEEIATRLKRNRKLAIALVLAPILLIGSCTTLIVLSDPGAPTSVKAVSPEIAEVSSYEGTHHAEVKVDLPELWDNADLPSYIGMLMGQIGPVVKAGASDIPADVKTITFWFTGPVVDRYGKEDRSKLMQFTIKADDLRKVDYQKLSSRGILDLTYDLTIRPLAQKSVDQYCAENREDSPLFCAASSS